MNRSYLTNKIYDYNEVVEMLSEDLRTINLKAFCEEHQLRYSTVWQALTNYQGKKFPKVISSLLQILGYNTEEVTAFKFLPKE